jgi:hypothetical protein
LRKALAATEGKIERLYGALAKGTVKALTYSGNLFRRWKTNATRRCA